MAKHVWSLLCSGTSVDKDTNQLSVFKILEEIQIPPGQVSEDAYKDGPVTLASGSEPLRLVSFWLREDLATPEMDKMRLQVVGPNRKVIYSRERDVDLRKHHRLRHITKFPGFLYCGPGVYEYVVQHRAKGTRSSWRAVARVPLRIAEKESSQ